MVGELEDERIPLGYLITFRRDGTWLHGDKRGSVDRFHNRFGTPRIPHNEQWKKYNRRELKSAVTSSSTRHPFFETP